MKGPGPCFPAPTLRQRILLAMRPGPITTNALMDRLGYGLTTVQASLFDLQQEGLVRGQSIDGYGWEYRLTPEGHAACPRWRDLTVAQPAEMRA